jgi:hypothetical protein
MLRKIVLALAAAATLGATALAPTAASAHWKGHGHGFGGGFRVGIIGGPAFVPVRCYWVEKFTPFGVRLNKLCNYY